MEVTGAPEMNDEELSKLTAKLTRDTREAFNNSLSKIMIDLEEKDIFSIVMMSLGTLVASVCDDMVNNKYPDAKVSLIDDVFLCSKDLLLTKLKIEKEKH